MTEFRVVAYSPERIDALRALWREYLGEKAISARETLFRWLCEGNPFLDGRPPYYLLMDGERVVGMHGHMPVHFSVRGKVEPGYMAHDDLLSADYRGKGLGKIMLQGVASQAPAFAGGLWHNDANRRLYEKAGWVGVPNLLPHLKVFDPMVFAEERLGRGRLARLASSALKAGLRLWDRRSSMRSEPGIRTEALERFDGRFDEFFDAISDQLGVAVVRNAAYLNWRFVEKPFNAYRRMAALDSDGNISGYAVYKQEIVDDYPRGLIVDALADPRRPEFFSALVRNCTRELSQQGVSYVSLLCPHRSLAGPLRKLGFVRARQELNFTIANCQGELGQDYVGRIENWYISHSDGDGDAWTVDIR